MQIFLCFRSELRCNVGILQFVNFIRKFLFFLRQLLFVCPFENLPTVICVPFAYADDNVLFGGLAVFSSSLIENV